MVGRTAAWFTSLHSRGSALKSCGSIQHAQADILRSVPVDIDAEVIANTPLSADYNVLALAAPEIASIAVPGQFVMVKARPGFDPLLRRPFSVFELLRDHSGAITGFSLLNKRIGASTTLLYEARRGPEGGGARSPRQTVHAHRCTARGLAGRRRRRPRAVCCSRRATACRGHQRHVVLRRAQRGGAVPPRLLHHAWRQAGADDRGRQPRRTRPHHRAA